MRRRIKALIACGVLLSAASASAAPRTERAARAEALYNEGRALLDAGRITEACAKLAESQATDPATGTLLNLANCHEREGKLATALWEFTAARVRAKADERNERVEFADEHIRALEARVGKIVVRLARGTPADAVVTLDGEVVAASEEGAATPVDPGTHLLRARSAAGTFEKRVEVREARQVVTIDVSLAGTAEVPAKQAEKPAPPPPKVEESRSLGLPVVVLGVGVAAAGVGTFFGVKAFSAWDERNAGCTPAGCTEAGVAAGDRAQDYALGANIGVGVGIVALAAGTYLLVRELSASPSRTSPSARVSATGAVFAF